MYWDAKWFNNVQTIYVDFEVIWQKEIDLKF